MPGKKDAPKKKGFFSRNKSKNQPKVEEVPVVEE